MGIYLKLIRPRHWFKNVAVLCALPFGLIQHGADCLAALGSAFAAFCLAASAIYAFNDVADRAEDALHPEKRQRPVASGAVSPAAALGMAVALVAAALLLAAWTPRGVWMLVAAYVALMIAYTLSLKHEPILDVIVIAVGFVIRAVAGALAVDVYISPWLIVCTFTLCLFLGFGKRRSEIQAMPDLQSAARHRRTLARYSPDLLNQLLETPAGIALLTFLLYIMDGDIETVFNKRALLYTFPLAAYGVFRYAMLIETTPATGPLELILKDRGLVITSALWAASCGLIILYEPLRATLGQP